MGQSFEDEDLHVGVAGDRGRGEGVGVVALGELVAPGIEGVPPEVAVGPGDERAELLPDDRLVVPFAGDALDLGQHGAGVGVHGGAAVGLVLAAELVQCRFEAGDVLLPDVARNRCGEALAPNGSQTGESGPAQSPQSCATVHVHGCRVAAKVSPAQEQLGRRALVEIGEALEAVEVGATLGGWRRCAVTLSRDRLANPALPSGDRLLADRVVRLNPARLVMGLALTPASGVTLGGDAGDLVIGHEDVGDGVVVVAQGAQLFDDAANPVEVWFSHAAQDRRVCWLHVGSAARAISGSPIAAGEPRCRTCEMWSCTSGRRLGCGGGRRGCCAVVSGGSWLADSRRPRSWRRWRRCGWSCGRVRYRPGGGVGVRDGQPVSDSDERRRCDVMTMNTGNGAGPDDENDEHVPTGAGRVRVKQRAEGTVVAVDGFALMLPRGQWQADA
jgi:hypothetical protein